jgi:hemoglobin
MSAETTKPMLYDRLGGVYSIAAVVDDFIDRVMHNPVLNANPAVDEAHHRVSAAGFKYYVTEMVCWATGGPQKYTGRASGARRPWKKFGPSPGRQRDEFGLTKVRSTQAHSGL